MSPIRLKETVASVPQNRHTRRLIEKEFSKLKPLLKIDKAFEKILLEESSIDIDYPLVFGFFRGEYKRECELLFHANKITLFEINENYINEKYGYDKSQMRKHGSTVQLLEPIRKFVNRFNHGN